MENYDLDTCLIEFANRQGSAKWTMRHAFQGCQVTGQTGSGKTTGSGYCIAIKFIQHGFGGLVLTAKADEVDIWKEYCRLTGRLKDLIIIEPGGDYFFNFLEYESSPKNSGGGKNSITANLVQVLKTVIKASQENSGHHSSDSFWEDSLDMLLSNVIDLCLLAYGKVTVPLMHDIINTIPKKEELPVKDKKEPKQKPTAFHRAFREARTKLDKVITEWKKSLTPEEEKLTQDEEVFEAMICERFAEARLIKLVDEFFSVSYRELSDRTRSIITFCSINFMYQLLKEPFYSLFCHQSSNITPEASLEGKIIVLNLPVKHYHKTGRDAQIIFKYIWQRAMEKRNVAVNGRPVFLYADEAQHFLHMFDADFQATARSSRIATVYLTQGLPSYLANMGGDRSEHRVNSLLTNLVTKIFHANSDAQTNNYASQLIGDDFFLDKSNTISMSEQFSTSETEGIRRDRIIPPEFFGKLLTGGPQNNYLVEGLIHCQGLEFKPNQHWDLVTFFQLSHI